MSANQSRNASIANATKNETTTAKDTSSRTSQAVASRRPDEVSHARLARAFAAPEHLRGFLSSLESPYSTASLLAAVASGDIRRIAAAGGEGVSLLGCEIEALNCTIHALTENPAAIEGYYKPEHLMWLRELLGSLLALQSAVSTATLEAYSVHIAASGSVWPMREPGQA